MENQDAKVEAWPGRASAARAGSYHYKNVRFKLARSPTSGQGWAFQPFGQESRHFATWQEAVAALEEACTAIAQHRAERRNR